MTRRASLGLALAALLVLAAAGGYAWWWFRLADGIRDGIARWADERRADGWRVSYGVIETGGFPGPVRIRLDTPRVTLPDGLDWQTAELRGRVAPWAPLRVHVDGPGHHELALPAATALQADFEAATAEVLLAPSGRLDHLRINLGGGTGRVVGGETFRVDAARLDLDPIAVPADADHSTTTLTVDIVAEGILLPETVKPALGPRVGVATLAARLQGRVPPEPAMTAATLWRDDGGTVEIDRLAVEWGPLQMAADGTFALDRTLQPMVAMSTSIRGFNETVDALTTAGVVKRKDAGTAKMVLGLLAKTPANGGAPAIEVPLTIQDGVLSLGPAALAKVPPIPWAAMPAGRR